MAGENPAFFLIEKEAVLYYNRGMEKSYILGIGAANVDVNGKSRKPLIMKDSNPGIMNVSVGGVTRNVLENVSRLGLPCKLVSAIGGDLYGKLILQQCEVCGIDTSHALMVNDDVSSTYMAILNDDGDMALALSDMHVINALNVEELKKRDELIEKAELVTFDPCLAEETIAYLTSHYGHKKLFCDPVSSAYALRLRPYLSHIHTLKPNRMELAILAEHTTETDEDLLKACQIVIDKGARRLFVSLGKEGTFYYDAEGNQTRASLKPIDHVVSASGAGDSFMAGVIYSTVHEFDIPTTLKYALASGSIALMAKGANNPELSVNKIREIIERG